MDILKRNLFFIICGVVASAGIVLAAVGVRSMTEVRTRMNDAGGLLRQLGMAKRPPTVNMQAINDENDRVAAVKVSYQEVIDWAHQVNRREPLVPGVFPEPRGQKKEDYRDAYVAEIDRLLNLLKAGEPPTDRDIFDMKEKIRNEGPRRGDPFAEKDKSDEEEKPANKSGLITVEEARTSAPARAALVKAQEIYCYANLDSLHVIDTVRKADISTPPGRFWDAQRTLWVQQDVIEALARINEEAADKLKEQDVEPWVGLLPVKDVISIRVSNYVFEDSEGSPPAQPGSTGPANPPGTKYESLTDYYSEPDGLYDVLQFTVKLVVDARQIPIVLKEICGDRFYTPLRVAYRVVPANLGMTDKIYGEDPAVTLVMDFEAYYFADIYRRLMPKVILEELGAERPEDEKEPED